jgi:uncharacterized repeat protein (TIGR01451 family)
MGITTMKRWTALMALVVLAVSAASVQAATQLLNYSSTVKYNYTDNLNGIAWNSRTYNDNGAGWASGPSVLSTDPTGTLGVNVGTTLPNPSTWTTPGHATYFRAHFTYSSVNKAILSLTNRIDDGAVFYLNGVEMQRLRVNAGAVTWTTLANAQAAGGGDATTDEVFTYTATNLVVGDNVLAVMVLQNATGSSDVTFGTAVSAENIVPVSITTQPVSRAIPANDPVSFTVVASGTLPTYQWQFRLTNNPTFANIANATNAIYTIPTVAANNAGFYQVIVRNPQNTVTSSVVTLTVTSDISGPEPISVGFDDNGFIQMYFDENVLRDTTTNVNNYVITMVGSTTNRLVVTNANSTGNRIQLKVTPNWTTNYTNHLQYSANGSNYIVYMNNVSDSIGNVCLPGTSIGLGFMKNYVPMSKAWDYQYGTAPQNNLDGQNWTANSYNVATNANWNTAQPALFYNLNGMIQSYPGPENTTLTMGSSCFYFRSTFTLPSNNGKGTISISQIIDDGGVVYLNGKEIYAYQMPTARPTTYGMFATGERGAGPLTVITPPDIEVTNLLSGVNYLAAEMHPRDLNPLSFGICFGISLDAAIPPATVAPTNGPRPDLFALASVLPTSVATNNNVTYTLTATNIGQAAATNVQFTAVFPANITVLAAPAGCVNVVDTNGIATLTCSTNTSIATNQMFTKVVQAKVTGTNTGNFLVRMTILQTPADKLYLNNTNAATLTVSAATAAPDIAVVASTSPAVVGVSSNINFSFTVTNNGTTAASSVVAVDTLPPGVTVVLPLPGGCVNNAGTVTCTIGTLNASTAQTRTIQVTSAATGTLTNRVVVSSTPADANTANNQATSTVTVSPKPQLVGVKPIGTTNVSMSWQSLLGVTYVMEYKPLLTSPTWIPVLTNAGTGGIITTNPPIPNPVSPTRFYRVRAQ